MREIWQTLKKNKSRTNHYNKLYISTIFVKAISKAIDIIYSHYIMNLENAYISAGVLYFSIL